MGSVTWTSSWRSALPHPGSNSSSPSIHAPCIHQFCLTHTFTHSWQELGTCTYHHYHSAFTHSFARSCGSFSRFLYLFICPFVHSFIHATHHAFMHCSSTRPPTNLPTHSFSTSFSPTYFCPQLQHSQALTMPSRLVYVRQLGLRSCKACQYSQQH